jgi:aspartyl-tRNA(Asn)/glutamyl-tRNA(Gln) amidotransferase subunit B
MVRGGDIQGLVAIQGLERIQDAARIQALVQQVLAAHTEQVTAYATGRSELFGFLMGALRSASKGCIDPGDMTTALSQALEPKA